MAPYSIESLSTTRVKEEEEEENINSCLSSPVKPNHSMIREE